MQRPDRLPRAAAMLASALLPLAGCAPGASCPAPCTVAIAHLVEINHHLAIPLVADGKVAEAVLDTGAEQSVLTASAADLLDARAVHNNDSSQAMVTPMVGEGFGGDTTGTYVTIGELSLAGGRLRDAPFITIPSFHLPDPRLTGLVGGDLLQNWDLDLAAGAGVLNLDLPQERSPVAPWHDHTTRVPLEDRSRKLIKIAVVVDGHPLTAIVDTGATRSVLEGETAAGREVTAGDASSTGSGIAGVRTPIRRHRFDDLSIGGLSFGPVEIGVSEAPNAVPDADMLIGLDLLRMTRVYVAYQAGELLIDEGQ